MISEEKQSGGSLRELARSAGVYGAANAFVSASKFFLIPVYAHYLSAGQYGLLGTSNTLSVLFVMLMGAGIERAVAREYFDHASDKAALARYFRSILGFLLAVNAAVLALIAGVGPLFAAHTESVFGLPYYPFVPLASGIALATALYSVLMVTLQVEQKSYHYIGGQIARFAVTICVTLILLIDFGWGAEGVLAGELAGTSAVALVLLLTKGRKLAGLGRDGVRLPEASGSPATEIIRNSLAYALPLVAVEAAGWLMSGVDRFVLAGYHGMAAVGLYTLAASLSQGMRIFTSAANTAYLPFFFSEAAREDTERDVFGRAGAMYAAVLGAACLAGILFSEEIIALVASVEYAGAHKPMGLLFASAYIFALYSIIVLPVMYLKKTGYLSVLMGVSGALNVGLCFALVPAMGVTGAAVASVTSTVLLFFAAYLLARSLYRIIYGKLFWVSLGAVSAVSAGLYILDAGLLVRAVTFGVMAPALLVPALLVWRGHSHKSQDINKPLRILFVPYFFYIQYPVFAPVIRRLREMGHEPVLLDIPNASDLDETAEYNPARFARDGVPSRRFRLLRFTDGRRRGMLYRVLKAGQYLINRERIRLLIDRIDPAVVVAGSHLGGMYIRFLQVLSSRSRKPFVSVWITADRLEERTDRLELAVSSALGFRDVLEWDNYNDYMGYHRFLTSSALIKRHMVSIGVPEEQISVTGTPEQDVIAGMLGRTRADVRGEMLRALGLPQGQKFVVLITEKIQMVLGEEYAHVMAEGFARCVEALPGDVTAVVRFHPGEPAHIREMLSRRLEGMSVAYDPGLELFKVLYAAEAVAGHYSAALYTAAFEGTPCATINTTPNPAYSFFGNGGMARYEAKSFEALAALLRELVTDEALRMKASEDMRGWCGRTLGSSLDGLATERMAEEIVRSAAGRRQRG